MESLSKLYRSYILGFVLSIIFTLTSYFLVVRECLDRWMLMYAIGALAIVQAFVQLVFFLHLGKEAKPYWNSIVCVFMASIVLILVVGSIWIMEHLNYNVMPSM